MTEKLSTAWECLPSYSTVDNIASQWWDSAAIKVLETSDNFNDVRLVVRFIRFQNSTIAADALSRRSTSLLDAFLAGLYGDSNIKKYGCDCESCKAQEIVEIIRQTKPSPPSVWDGDWILLALHSTDISVIVERLDLEIHLVICKISFEDWVTWSLGYEDDAISKLLEAVVNFRNKLAQYVWQHSEALDELLLLQEASLYCYVGVILLTSAAGIGISTASGILDVLYRDIW
jgi:hypothetical protein